MASLKTLIPLLLATMGISAVPPITRNGTSLLQNNRPWRATGPNIYWLGLDENVVPPPGVPYDPATKASYPHKQRVTEAMAMVQALGGTMIRAHTLGISTGNPLSLWPERGVVNEDAFEAMDWAVWQAGVYGVRLLVPLVDNYDYYHGGKFSFLRWAGLNLSSTDPLIQSFYTNETIVASFKEYIHTLLTHRNKYTGLTYAEDPTIFAYESGNELAGPVWGDMDVPVEWIREIARFVKGLAPGKLFVDGTYGINSTHLDIEEVDIFSDHFYPPDIDRLRDGIEAVERAGKVYFAGEYDWVGQSGGDDLEDFYEVLETSDAVGGDAFWSLFGRDAPDCETWVNHDDGFTLQYGNPNNTAYTNGRIQLIRKHFIEMSWGKVIGSHEPLPPVSCPPPPPQRVSPWN